MSWPPENGPASASKPSILPSWFQRSDTLTGKTSDHRSVEAIEGVAIEGVAIKGVAIHANQSLDALIDQISRRFSDRTASALKQMGLFRDRTIKELNPAEQSMVIGLALYIHNPSSLPPTTQELTSYEVSALHPLPYSPRPDSFSASHSSSRSDPDIPVQLSSEQEQLFLDEWWDQGDELAHKRYLRLKNNPLIQLIDTQVDGSGISHNLMKSVQAAPLIDKLLQEQRLTETETAALLAQAAHINALLQKGQEKPYSSAEAAMPLSSEVDITEPDRVRSFLTTLGDSALSFGAEREKKLASLQNHGEEALECVEFMERHRHASKEDLHSSHSMKKETHFLQKMQRPYQEFRTRIMGDPALYEQWGLDDFASTRGMLKLLKDLSDKAAATGKKNDQMCIVLDAIKERTDQWASSQSNDDLAKVCQSVWQLSRLSENVHISETLELIAEHLSDQVMTHIREEFEASLRHQLRELEKGGSHRTITVSVGLGAGLAAYGIEGVSLDFGLEFSFKVAGADDTRIREFKVVNSSFRLTGGDEKLLSASATLGLKKSSGRVFRNLDDFVRFHANDLAPLLLSRVENVVHNAKGMRQARKQQTLKHKVVADGDLLTKRLQEHGLLLPSQRIKVDTVQKPNYADFKRREHSIKGAVSALGGVLEASLTATNTVTDFTTKTDLLATLKNNPAQFYAKKPEFISFWIPVSNEDIQMRMRKLWCREHGQKGQENSVKLSDLPPEELSILRAKVIDGKQFKYDSAGRKQKRISGTTGIDWIKAQQKTLQATDVPKATRLDIREKCKQAILDQYSERDLYYYTLNAMDGHTGVPSEQRKRLTEAEKSFRKTFNARGRGEFIEAHTFTYFRLWMTYMMTFTDHETPAIDDALFYYPLEQFIEPTLTKPQVNLSDDKDIRGHLRIPAVATSSAKSLDGDFAVKVPGTHIKGSVHGSYTRTEKNTNPDNDGEYMNLSFTLGAGGHLGKAVHAIGEHIKQKNLSGSRSPDIRFDLALSALDSADLDITAESDVKLELNFIHRDRKLFRPDDQERDWHLQYVRVTGSRSAGASTPGIGIPTGPVGELKLSFGAKVSGANNWYERVGNNTLTYIYTKYNGWKSGRKVGGDQCYWQRWSKQNSQYLDELLVYMGRPHKNAWEEMNETFKVIEANLSALPGDMSYLQLVDFKNSFSRQLRMYSVCSRLKKMARKKTLSEDDMRKTYGKIKRDWPDISPRIKEEAFVQLLIHLRSHLTVGDTRKLEKALGINRETDKLDFATGMMPALQDFLDLQHKAYLLEARRRYAPSFKRLRIV